MRKMRKTRKIRNMRDYLNVKPYGLIVQPWTKPLFGPVPLCCLTFEV